MRPQLFRGHFRALRRSGLAQFCVAVAPACLGLAVLYAWPARPTLTDDARPRAESAHARPIHVSVEEADARLQSAASAALNGRDGTIVVLDAQTGRIRAAVNLDLATQGALPPGSAVKPFTLLAALRSGVVEPGARLACRRHFTRPGVEFSCAHPVFRPPFDAEQALAHSCNYYFARLGERLAAADFNQTLASFGFGPPGTDGALTRLDDDAGEHHTRRPSSRSRIGATPDSRRTRQTATQSTTTPPATTTRRPPARGALSASSPAASSSAASRSLASPRLPLAPLRTESALGEGDALLVTPLQLIAAYAALFNGGRLLEPRQAASANFAARELSHTPVSDEERALLVAALRGAVKYGTAAAGGLGELPTRVFGKTGTATEIGGFRTDGWFVGFASAHGTSDNNESTTGDVDMGRGYDVQSGGMTDGDVASLTSARADEPAPSEVSLAVLVFLKRAQGRQAAAASRAVFAEYARLTAAGTARVGETGDNQVRNSFSPSNDSHENAAGDAHAPRSGATTHDTSAQLVRVRQSRDSAPVAMSLDEYLFGALAAEASTEDKFAALKAQAVVSRTYALKHFGRHAREGFDFCATTHCQRHLRVTAANSRPEFHAQLRRAVAETSGETLRDPRGRIINAYFSASCGGMTADVQTLWGTPAREPYERGVRDDYCTVAPNARWTDRVPARRLALALREDARSDVGARLEQITIVRRDRTGRAELVALAGERRRTLRGWDFKIIVGRSLGWSVVKSSRFTVAREGADFVFRGSGFGHGLGLCQHGAHTLARRGASHLQILAHYFPGATVFRDSAANNQTSSTLAHETPWHADAATPLDDATREAHVKPVGAWLAPTRGSFNADQTRRRHSLLNAGLTVPALSRGGHEQAPRLQIFFPTAIAARVLPTSLTLASANFRFHYPAREVGARREVETALRTLEAARADLLRRLSAASLPAPALPAVELFAHETTAGFVAATGQPGWVAAATRGARVELQPLSTLGRRRILPQTLRHEFAHVAVSALSRGRAQRWLAEGLAAHFAGEGPQLSRHAPAKNLRLEELEARLARPASAAEARALYAAAYAEVAAIIRAEGESAVWRLAARS